MADANDYIKLFENPSDSRPKDYMKRIGYVPILFVIYVNKYPQQKSIANLAMPI